MSLGLKKIWFIGLCSAMMANGEPLGNTQDRSKREFSYSAPIYYDSLVPTPMANSQPLPQVPQQTTNPLQGIPIFGTLLGNLPGINNLPSFIPFGNLGNLGTNLGGLLNLGGLVPGVGLPQTQSQQCPLGQISRCRCENLIQIPQPKETDSIQIVQQSVKINKEGQREITARLSNGVIMYQRSGNETVSTSYQSSSSAVQGYYALPIKDNKYLTIYYIITDADYTVKADVTSEPPKSELDESSQLQQL